MQDKSTQNKPSICLFGIGYSPIDAQAMIYCAEKNIEIIKFDQYSLKIFNLFLTT